MAKMTIYTITDPKLEIYGKQFYPKTEVDELFKDLRTLIHEIHLLCGRPKEDKARFLRNAANEIKERYLND